MESEFKSQIRDKNNLYEKLLMFPPFFTIQEQTEVRKKQLAQWAEITHTHLKRNRINASTLNDLNAPSFDLFTYKTQGVPSTILPSK
jgi:hypothetical protein